MNPTERHRLFLSYGRADATQLADRLAQDLAAHDLPSRERFDVWKDRVEIEAGRPGRTSSRPHWLEWTPSSRS